MPEQETLAPPAETEPSPEPEEGAGSPEEAAPGDGGGSPSLAWKLARIMGEMDRIPKDEYRHVEVETRGGGSYSYDYIPESVLMERLRPKLAAARIAAVYSDEILRSPDPEIDGDNLTIVRVELRLVDGETGEELKLASEGYGTDYGDKGANKAKTSAMRYLLWKTFLFASDVEPEGENVERRSGSTTGARAGGRPASDKQKSLVRRLIEELARDNVTFSGDHPDAAIHRRTPVEDLKGPQSSKLIDFLMDAQRSAPGDLDAGPLDELLGPRSEGGDFPPDEEPGEGYGG